MGPQPSTMCIDGRQPGSPAVDKLKGSAAVKPKAAKQTSTKKKSSAGPKRVIFADCQEKQAGAEHLACSKAPVETAAKQSHTRAARRKCVSTAAQSLQPAHKVSLVPDTYADSDGSQQHQAEGVQAAGKRLKRCRASKTSEDRCFIKQFAAEAHAQLGSSSSSQRKAVDSSQQKRCMSPEDSKYGESQSLGQSSAVAAGAEAKEPVISDSSAKQAIASTGGSIAAQEESPAASPSHSTAPAGEHHRLLLCIKIQHHTLFDIKHPMTARN